MRNGLLHTNTHRNRFFTGKTGFRIIFCCAALLLNACAVNISDYRGTQPALDLKQFFNGELVAWGIFQSRNGEVKRHFKVEMVADWSGDTCTLTEIFTFNDSETQQRIWTIQKHNAHRYTGSADDVFGAALGEAYGNALNWQYTLKLAVEDKYYKVKFDDWMYLIDENTLINRATVSKFGFRVGEVTLFIQKI